MNPLVRFESLYCTIASSHLKRDKICPPRILIIHNGERLLAALYGSCLGLVRGTSDGKGLVAFYLGVHYVHVLLYVQWHGSGN